MSTIGFLIEILLHINNVQQRKGVRKKFSRKNALRKGGRVRVRLGIGLGLAFGWLFSGEIFPRTHTK